MPASYCDHVLEPARCIEIVTAAVDEIARAAEGHLDAPVEHCPNFDMGRLLEHTGGFCRVVAGRVGHDEEWVPGTGNWQKAPQDEVAGDPIGWHRRWGVELVAALRGSDPDVPIKTWVGHRTRYFWFRRAAQELTVHRWDAERAAGASTAIDAAVALDGIDEFLGEFATRAAVLLNGSGETYQFIVEGTGQSFTVTAQPDRFISNSHLEPDVIAIAPAEVHLRFLWGRATPADLEGRGRRELLEQWHERVRI